MKKQRAFTLVELVVVVAMVSLSTSILIPTMENARFQSKVIRCKSNLHQWGQIVNLYAANSDEKLPTDSYSGFNGWDVPRSFFPTFDPNQPDVEGYLFDGFDLTIDMYMCPTLPAQYSATWKQYMEQINNQSGGFSLSPIYLWWVPRLPLPSSPVSTDGLRLFPHALGSLHLDFDASTGGTSPSGKKFPVSVSSKDAKDIPIMTDTVMKVTFSARDLSDNPTVDKSTDILTVSMNANEVFGFHAYKPDRLESVNQLFVDGHVFTNTTETIQTHFIGNLLHLW